MGVLKLVYKANEKPLLAKGFFYAQGRTWFHEPSNLSKAPLTTSPLIEARPILILRPLIALLFGLLSKHSAPRSIAGSALAAGQSRPLAVARVFLFRPDSVHAHPIDLIFGPDSPLFPVACALSCFATGASRLFPNFCE